MLRFFKNVNRLSKKLIINDGFVGIFGFNIAVNCLDTIENSHAGRLIFVLIARFFQNRYEFITRFIASFRFQHKIHRRFVAVAVKFDVIDAV